jgi:ABC-2 type transport system permease protein
MPPFFQYISLLNPVRHFLVIVRAIFLRGDGVVELWPQFVVLTAMAAAVLLGATARFRRSTASGG